MPAALAAALPLGAAWVAHERRLTARGGAPLIELALFGVRGFRLGLGLAVVFYTGLTCVFLLLGLYRQDGMGMTPPRAWPSPRSRSSSWRPRSSRRGSSPASARA